MYQWPSVFEEKGKLKHSEKTLMEQRRELKANSVHIIMALTDDIIYSKALILIL